MSEFRKSTREESELLFDTMRANVGAHTRPKVGMFWYNPERGRLVGVRSVAAQDLQFNEKGRKTVSDLHHTSWDDIREDAIGSGSTDKIWSETDYTQIPRGCVFQIQVPDSDAEYYEVLVGKWIHEYPDAVELIVKAFNLADVEKSFIYSHHWDIGHGTSEFYI
ncbi:MAG: hypothetical protein FWG45_04025 [Oscillospiraceae bacterium]|nr:hypothetical protein [Oscillospiraceae bacterium]